MDKVCHRGLRIKKFQYIIFAENGPPLKSNSRNILSYATFWSEAPLRLYRSLFNSFPSGRLLCHVWFNGGMCCLWRVCIFHQKMHIYLIDIGYFTKLFSFKYCQTSLKKLSERRNPPVNNFENRKWFFKFFKKILKSRWLAKAAAGLLSIYQIRNLKLLFKEKKS